MEAYTTPTESSANRVEAHEHIVEVYDHHMESYEAISKQLKIQWTLHEHNADSYETLWTNTQTIVNRMRTVLNQTRPCGTVNNQSCECIGAPQMYVRVSNSSIERMQDFEVPHAYTIQSHFCVSMLPLVDEILPAVVVILPPAIYI